MKIEILPEYIDSKHWEHHFISDTTQLGDTAQPPVTADCVGVRVFFTYLPSVTGLISCVRRFALLTCMDICFSSAFIIVLTTDEITHKRELTHNLCAQCFETKRSDQGK